MTSLEYHNIHYAYTCVMGATLMKASRIGGGGGGGGGHIHDLL